MADRQQYSITNANSPQLMILFTGWSQAFSYNKNEFLCVAAGLRLAEYLKKTYIYQTYRE